MRELVIRNVTLIVDARGRDAMQEARSVIETANEHLDDADGGPTLYLGEDGTLFAEYRDNGDEEDDPVSANAFREQQERDFEVMFGRKPNMQRSLRLWHERQRTIRARSVKRSIAAQTSTLTTTRRVSERK